jgi:hypothetical protein
VGDTSRYDAGMPTLSPEEVLVVDAAIARVKKGEPLFSTFMDEHGLKWPIYTGQRLIWQGGAFRLMVQIDELGPTIIEGTPTTVELDEVQLREKAATDSGLRYLLGLQKQP